MRITSKATLRGTLAAMTSIVALCSGGIACAQADEQQEPDAVPSAADANYSDETIIVTGTLIKGVAPVGSPVIGLDADQIAAVAPTSTSDLLNRVPQLMNIGMTDSTATGGSAPQSATLNTTFSRSLNLRGLGSSATLTLFNGQRIANNLLGNATDIDAYPVAMVRNIEVVPDGASATYGTDAVAGVANVILRRPFTGGETSVQYGIKEHDQDDIQVSQLLGYSWGSGGILLGGQWSRQGALSADAHRDLYQDDLTPYLGAAGVLPTFASIPNISGLVGPGGTGVLYAVPTGLGGNEALQLADLGAGNNPRRQSAWLGARPIPEIERTTIAFTMEQELSPAIRFEAFGSYNWREAAATHNSVQLTSTLNVPSTNPYSPCAPGNSQANGQGLACGPSGNVTARYNWYGEFQETVVRASEAESYNITGRFDVDLGAWSARLSAHTSNNRENAATGPSIYTAGLNRVLSGIGKPADVPFFNPFCDNTNGPCNDARTLDYIRTYSRNTQENGLTDFNLTFNGPLFDMSGGAVRLALGGQYSHQTLKILNYRGATADNPDEVPTATSDGSRNIKAVFAELYVPIVGDDNGSPGMRGLELVAAARYTDYSDVGDTFNPKFGFTYRPFEGIRLSGTYGTSFRAPTLRESDPAAATGLLIRNGVCGDYEGITCGSPSASLSTVSYIGGRAGIQPETADTWSLGLDIAPPSMPGFRVNGSLYWIDYRNRISLLGPTAVNMGVADEYITFNPTYFPTRSNVTQAEFDALVAGLLANPLYGFPTPPASPVPFVVDGRQLNTGRIKTSGLDLMASYDFALGGLEAHVAASGTYVFKYEVQQIPGTPIVDQVNKYGYQPRFRGRLEAGIEKGGWALTGWLNYVNPYEVNASDTSPLASAEYLKIDGHATVDLSLSYETGENAGLFEKMRFQVVANNLFDAKPPFFLNAGGGVSILYDPQLANAFGRIVSLRVSKAF